MGQSVQKKMLEFDKIFKECGSMPSFMGHFFGYFMESLSYLLLSVFLNPAMWEEMENSDFVMFGLCIVLTQIGIKLHLSARLQVREEGEDGECISVYEFLKYAPIAPKDIFYNRVKYLLRLLAKRLVLLYLIQGIWFAVQHRIVWDIMVVPVGYICIEFFALLLEIKPNNRKKDKGE